MRVSQTVSRALTTFALAMLAGCSSAAQVGPTQPGAGNQLEDVLAFGRPKPVAPPATHSFFDPNAEGKPLIFVSDTNKSVINIYLQGNGNPQVGQIVGDLYAPIGLTTDSARNVYVTNANGGTVVVFEPPYTRIPKLTLDDVGNSPRAVAVSKSGLVAVGNFSANATVSFYKRNDSKPCATVSDYSFGGVAHDVFDDRGNLYIDGENGSGFVVGRIRGGCHPTAVEMLSTGNVIGNYPADIKINKRDQIAIEDSKALAIYTYNPPRKGSLGNPVATTPLTGINYPYAFAFVASGRSLYASDYVYGPTNEYAYPAGGSAEDTIPVATQGVAVTPPLVP
ncbi:MAG: hypothetical protein JO078_07485 [Candidatus Eremiobacteraeota bacterium]|nr:hypothetical protein [Candidatus Eremiobacteraeota bacterium]MBV9056196.1 hypothetical protein [Candidatus Eremiobacteraeota bacterium]MBV9699952.1 hypothetical protein [Candidatus Eremiobacteraeota bacterium]